MKFGCNYWASNSGTEMWKEWDENVVREDFRRLKEAGNDVVRVFPLWRDFQPVEVLCKWRSTPFELGMWGKPLPLTKIGQAGCDEEMFRRFHRMLDFAKEFDLEVIVGLITGWMSGTLYVPPALVGKDVFTDPLALKLEAKFIRVFVDEFKSDPSISMWELGNESDCMVKINNPNVAYNWINMVSSTIRSVDPTRPVASGMHGQQPVNTTEFADDGNWTIQELGELCDYLTPHPYAMTHSKKGAKIDNHLSARLGYLTAIETLFYHDLGKREAFVEETNTFNNSYCSESTKATYLRGSMLNAWAHGSEYFLLWCGFDQSMLKYAPYDWSAWERENGEFNAEGKLRAAAAECGKVAKWTQTLPFKKLASHRRQAVCILTRGMGTREYFGVGWSSFMLSKRLGFDLAFQIPHYDDLIDSDIYLLPSICSLSGLFGSEMDAILKKVEQGATLFISSNEDGVPTGVEKILGCEFVTRERRLKPAKVTFHGKTFEMNSAAQFILKPLDCEVLATEEDGNPAFLRHQYGKGEIYFLPFPLESNLADMPHAFDHEANWDEFYTIFAPKALAKRTVFSRDKMLHLTERTDENGNLWVIAVNNGNDPLPAAFTTAPGWKIKTALPAEIPAHDGIIFAMEKAN